MTNAVLLFREPAVERGEALGELFDVGYYFVAHVFAHLAEVVVAAFVDGEGERGAGVLPGGAAFCLALQLMIEQVRTKFRA